MPVHELGAWGVNNVNNLDGLVSVWDAGHVPYVYDDLNSNTFAHWFGTQAGFPQPVGLNGMAGKIWLAGWDHPSPIVP